jgi:hypothetical protein
MEMSVDQTRREIRAGEVDDFFRVVIAEANDAPVVDGDIGIVNFATKDIDELRVLEEEVCWRFTAGDPEFVLDVAHGIIPAPLPRE